MGCAADMTPAETRAIAEEGFTFGLPIVMNYAVMLGHVMRPALPLWLRLWSDGSAIDPSTGRRHLETTGNHEGAMAISSGAGTRSPPLGFFPGKQRHTAAM